MARKRGSSHTTLTETATILVAVLKKQPGIKMIAPGMIDARRSGARHITATYTTAGIQFIVSGQGVQKLAVHLEDTSTARSLIQQLRHHKSLQRFQWNEREKKLV